MSGGCGCGGQGATCQTNQKMVVIGTLSLLSLASGHKKIAAAIAAGAGVSYSYFNNDKLSGAFNKLFSSEKAYDGFVEVEISPKMEGTLENNLMIAHLQGSEMFPGFGINKIYANIGPDNIYFSMCKLQVIEGKSTIIKEFDHTKDKITLFCSKRNIEESDVSTHYDADNRHTKVTITNNVNTDGSPKEDLFFVVDGKHEGHIEFVLNEKWKMTGEHKYPFHNHNHGDEL